MATGNVVGNPSAGSLGGRQPSLGPDLAMLEREAAPALPNSKKWCLKPVLTVYTPDNTNSSLTLGNIVSVERIYTPPDPKGITWSKITRTSPSPVIQGWVNDFYLDDYNEGSASDVVKIEHPASNTGIAKQYMLWDDKPTPQQVQFNMCGELCVAYVVKNEIDGNTSLEAVLRNWRDHGSSFYNLNDIKVGLDASTLIKILQLYLTLDNSTQIASNIQLELPTLTTHYLIARVMINKSGALIAKDDASVPVDQRISHWVVVEEITRDGWALKLYNPFPNKFQEYSLSEFVSSYQNSRLWVKRKQPLPAKQADGKIFQVGLDDPKPPADQPQQYLERAGDPVPRKTNLCGEFCVAYVLSQEVDDRLAYWTSNPPSDLRQLTAILNAYISDKQGNKSFTIGTVLDYWKKVDPGTYNKTAAVNGTTGKDHLKSILRAYGYTDDGFINLADGMRDPYTTSSMTYFASPGKMQKKLKDYYLIAGVEIEPKLSGKLVKRKNPTRVPHWVVVEKIETVGRYLPDNSFGGNGGWVTLYNPFMNRREGYSYREFMDSMGPTVDGLWLNRNVKKPASLITKDAVVNLVSNPLSGLSEGIVKWINTNAASFASDLAVALRVAGVSGGSPVDPATTDSNLAEKVASVIGPILVDTVNRGMSLMSSDKEKI